MSAAAAGPKSLSVSVRDTDTVHDVKRKYGQHIGVSPDRVSISFREHELENDRPLGHYSITSGDLHLVPLGSSLPLHPFGPATHPPQSSLASKLLDKVHVLAAKTEQKKDGNGNICGIVVRSSIESDSFPNLEFTTITLSWKSDPYKVGKPYAGFILYGHYSDIGTVQNDWTLNDVHCTSAYLVIQNTESENVTRYKTPAPGAVHGAVYWNVFGEGTDTSKAIGEGFALKKDEYAYSWNSGVFNEPSPSRFPHPDKDPYHDGEREISELAKIVVGKILDDWKEHCPLGKAYSVLDLLP